ncbi:hypothetical protein DVH24_022769 [Malus domestica]|uniref:Uncharacterized protein n=1 Tax=Malus domestica TaxID=3750 RepID=A0A498KSG3_MALDO|nr:hypothetical protein DVH24_022769 [Malus domestica]
MRLAERREGGEDEKQLQQVHGQGESVLQPASSFRLDPEDPAYRAVSMLLSELKQKNLAASKQAQPILPELLENSTTKVIEYGRKHVEGRDGDSTDVGKSGD